ncbi:Hypothetical predicted protein [Marmota monax]|uniref:Uncharacterized protein n=1 Tax=Marmota monax TaxID=9995 RepID=A0A5E4BI19_MARMO|nr:Hypothetical predicted protein [Marmota monax]
MWTFLVGLGSSFCHVTGFSGTRLSDHDENTHREGQGTRAQLQEASHTGLSSPLATTLKHTGTQRSQAGGLRRAAVPKEGNTSCGAHLLRGPGHLPKGLGPQGLVKDHSAPSCSWPCTHPPGLESHLDIAQAHHPHLLCAKGRALPLTSAPPSLPGLAQGRAVKWGRGKAAVG